MIAETMSQSAFARHIGKSRQYVAKLKTDGRLVMDDAGRVLVNESLDMILATKGARDDVADRHADHRVAKENAPADTDAQPQEENAPESEIISEGLTLKEVTMRIKLAEMRDKEASSQIREIEARAKAGEFVAIEDADAAMKFIGATVRGLLDVFPDQVAPIVAPITGLDDCHAMLQEQCRNVLVSLGQAIEKQRNSLTSSS